MASNRGSCFLETDLDQYVHQQADRIATPHPAETKMAVKEDLETAIAQTASSFAIIKESLHNLLEKMRLNRTETPRKFPDRTEALPRAVPCRSDSEPEIYEKPSQLPIMEDGLRNAVPWWSSESSCDFDSDDSGFQFDSQNRKYVMDHSGSSDVDTLESDPSEERSLWDRSSVTGDFRSFGCDLTATVLGPADQCCCPHSSSGHPKSNRTVSGPSGHNAQLGNPQTKYRAREVLTGKGQLKLALYINSGLLTIHVEKAKKLESKKSKLCNSYVRIEMFPKPAKKPNCRTLLVKNENCPLFDQKFSFELTSSNESKRIFISVWHRDLYRRNSEFLGCMSFGIAHVTKHPVLGWYRLMTEKLGKNKHFEVKSGSKLSSILRKVGIYSSSSMFSRHNSKENMDLSCHREKEKRPSLGSIGNQLQSININFSSHQHYQHHNRPAASKQENGQKIRVRAQIEYWSKSTKNQEEIQKRHTSPQHSRRSPSLDILKSVENIKGRHTNIEVKVSPPTIREPYELFMDASVKEDYLKMNDISSELCAEMKYPDVDRIWFVDEVGGNR